MRVRIPQFVRALSYRPSIRRVVRAKRLRRIARRAYYYVARPPGDILQLKIRNIRATFYVRTAEELRTIESEALKERQMMERLISSLRVGGTVYDIGANIGLYTVPLGKAVGDKGKVIAFEPMSKNYDRLQEHLRLNGLTNVRSFRNALGAWTGQGKLYLTNYINGTISQTPSLVPVDALTDYEVVEVVEGDRFRELKELPLPQVVKIDVEGYEYGVLRGLRQVLAEPTCEVLCCEIHPQLLSQSRRAEDVMGLIKSLGFSRIDVFRCRERVEYHAVCHKS